LPSDRFVFEGFLPTKGKARQDRLKEIGQETRTLILYESPHKLRQTLQDLAQVCGQDRSIMLGRELTKLYEKCYYLKIEEAIAFYEKTIPKGEYTLVIAGKEEAETLSLSSEQVKQELQQLLAQGVTRSQASRQLAKVTSLSRQEIYQLSIELE
jgi:16S rRNA (cytidine1402-2'-O)-methyltransferase